MEKRRTKIKKPSWHTVVTVVIGLCLLFMVLSAYRINAAPYGTVELDLNGKLVMTVSKREKVLEVQAGDEASSALLEGLDYGSMSREEITDRLFAKALSAGLLQEKGAVITVGGGSPEWRETLAQEIRQQTQAWQDSASVEVRCQAP